MESCSLGVCDDAMEPGKPAIFSFFSGSGLLDLGFEFGDYTIAFVNEFSESFMNAYKYARVQLNLPSPKYGYHCGDVADFLDSRRDEFQRYVENARSGGQPIGFIGGPPCPDFSVAGKNRGREGDNGKLSQTYVDLICEYTPDFFLFENVKGLWKTAKHREYYDELKQQLERAGYVMTDRLVNAIEFGVPQDRERVMLFGIQRPFLSKYGTDPSIIDSFPWDRNKTYDLGDVKKRPWPTTTPYSEDSVTECPDGIIPELTVQYWFEKNDVTTHPNGKDHFIPRNGLRRMVSIEEGDSSRKCYKRLHRWRYSPTAAYGNNEVHLHPYESRRISVAEALAIQSLPMGFALPPTMTLTDKFKTVGNGVPFLLARGISQSITDFLEMITCET